MLSLVFLKINHLSVVSFFKTINLWENEKWGREIKIDIREMEDPKYKQGRGRCGWNQISWRLLATTRPWSDRSCCQCQTPAVVATKTLASHSAGLPQRSGISEMQVCLPGDVFRELRTGQLTSEYPTLPRLLSPPLSSFTPSLPHILSSFFPFFRVNLLSVSPLMAVIE